MQDLQLDLSPDLFEPLTRNAHAADDIVRPSVTFGQDAWRRFRENRMAMFGAAFIILLVIAAIFADYLTPHSYYEQDLSQTNQGPSLMYWFGRDNFGRDIFTRVLYGARISLLVGFSAALFTTFIGILYGGISGFAGGRTDMLMMRILEVLSGVPNMLILILLMVVMGSGIWPIILAMGLTSWTGMSRMVRAEVLRLREQEFVLAARVMGIPNKQILLRHLVPNAVGTILVNLTFTIPTAIFQEAFLSFLGLGVSAPMASWGVLASDSLQLFTSYPSQLIFPSLAIMITVLSFNYLGDGLRDALDPKMRD
jgi:oligopeptide transport system permease protein